MESCCRVCSRSDDFRRFPLYAVAEVSQEVIANMIRDTSDTQVSTEDGLPQQICPDCLIALSLAFSFRKQCRRSDAKFREYWDGRGRSQSTDQHPHLLQQHHPQQQQQHQQQHQQLAQHHQQQQLPRRSQSQAQDDSAFEAVSTIKEEVDIYDYEYSSVPSHEDQWVIQNPRTIGEGAMTVVHNSGQYYDDPSESGATSGNPLHPDHQEGPRGLMSLVPMGALTGHHLDPAAELGESSGLGAAAHSKMGGAAGGEKWKKTAPPPERFSQRIRRQPDLIDIKTLLLRARMEEQQQQRQQAGPSGLQQPIVSFPVPHQGSSIRELAQTALLSTHRPVETTEAPNQQARPKVKDTTKGGCGYQLELLDPSRLPEHLRPSNDDKQFKSEAKTFEDLRAQNRSDFTDPVWDDWLLSREKLAYIATRHHMLEPFLRNLIFAVYGNWFIGLRLRRAPITDDPVPFPPYHHLMAHGIRCHLERAAAIFMNMRQLPALKHTNLSRNITHAIQTMERKERRRMEQSSSVVDIVGDHHHSGHRVISGDPEPSQVKVEPNN